MTKTFTNSSNASRAAKKALGPEAKSGTDFFITKFSPTQYAWHKAGEAAPLAPAAATSETPKAVKPAKAAHEPKPAKAPKVKKAKRVKGDAKIEDQPQMRRIVEMCSRKTGATIEDIAGRFECEQHTVRGAISRLRNEAKIDFIPVRVGRKKIFFAGPDAKANAEEHTPAAAE